MTFPDLFHKLGPVGWPLLIFSFIAVILLIERTLFFARIRTGTTEEFHSVDKGYLEKIAKRKGNLSRPVTLALDTYEAPAAQRDETLKIWLRTYATKLKYGLRFMMLIAVISPLLGLLGTVLGMINAFQVIAVQDGPIHPAMLAEGISQAMLTTAVGLSIALPTLLGAHGFRILADRHIESLSVALSRLSLAISNTKTPKA
ncbi:MotA/TolQ/ExbB proton channel family protein [Kiloniella antarctica]|uniref:MotA/TolQ/ExbB proton channel family protein n=1 Tax=Kiloniella antarctica TaxID=1550907 RepID=A0ABW5BPW5_9PROT